MFRKSKFIVIALCLIVVGLGIGGAGIALGGPISSFSNPTPFNGVPEILESFNKIDVTSGTLAVTIKEGETYSISVETGSKVELQYGVKEDTLYVEQDSHSMKWNFPKFLKGNLWNNYGGEIVITVPKDTTLDEISVTLGAEEGRFENLVVEDFNLMMGVASTNILGLHAEQVTIEGGVGELTLKESTLKDAKINMGVGNMKVETALSGDLEIQGGIGNLDIVLDGSENDYNYEISRGGGKITLNDKKHTGMMDISIQNKSEQTIDIEAGLGNISIETRS